MSTEKASAATAGDAPKPDKKYFSVPEANRALPYVTRVVEDVVQVYSQIVDLRHQIESPEEAGDTDALERQYEAHMDRLSELVDELHMVGVELKDFEKGLVDFPAVHEGREVLLCWHQGEDRVLHWHEVDAGFDGRQPVEQLHEG